MSKTSTRVLTSYRTRVLVSFVLVVGVLVIAWAWSLTGPLSNAVTEQQRLQLLAVARSGVLLSRQSQPQAVASDLGRETGVRVTIVAQDGTVLADSNDDPSQMENHGDRPEVKAALAGRTGAARRVSRTEGSEQLYVAVPATINGSPAALRTSQKLASIEDVVARTRRLGLLLLFGAVALAALVAARVSRTLTRPVGQLVAAAQSMASGDLGAPIPRPGGELGTLADALVDLREQMRERIGALEAEEENLRSVLDGLDDAVWLVEGDRIRFANRSASVLFKEPTGGWRERRIGETGLPVPLQSYIVGRLAEGERSSEELPRDPTGRTLRVTSTPILSEHAARQTLIVVSDVTDRARLDHIRRDFVANASHELKTPVAGIHLLAESAAQAAADGDDEQARAFAEQIERETNRLQQMVKDLLDLSRLEGTPAPGSIADVRTVVDNAIVGHQGAASSRAITLESDYSAIEGQDVYAAADPTDLTVALDNLLDNAITYTELGGVTVRVAVAEESVSIAVTDSGIGIPEADLPRIFERFYRVDRSRSRAGGGTGLGLALVRHAAERAGGSVLVESSPGEGSTFALVIPRAR